VSRRSVISSMIQEQLAAANSSAVTPSPGSAAPPAARVTAGPVRTMGLTLDRLELERKSLEEALATGGAIVEIAAEMVETSFAADRFAETSEPAFESLKQSIAESGQEVPILVRPVPGRPGYYQAAYGHRRLRACRALGIKVKALIKPLSDAELVVAQGLENAARVDLSFIERATFALGLETRGFDRPVIMAALATDKTELSKMIAAASALPADIVRAIGPAPKAGRRRWLQLAERLGETDARRRVQAVIADSGFEALATDVRFTLALDAVITSPARNPLKAPIRTILKSSGGKPLARIEETDGKLTLVVDRVEERGFADYLVREMSALYEAFAAGEAAKPPRGTRR
jgi:ParB family transcriptional regulator, chromosome partitioning protein